MALSHLLDTTPPSLLATAACGGLRPEPDCRPRRDLLHLSYSCAPPFGPAMLVTHDPRRNRGAQGQAAWAAVLDLSPLGEGWYLGGRAAAVDGRRAEAYR